jgi:hypothetical protein
MEFLGFLFKFSDSKALPMGDAEERGAPDDEQLRDADSQLVQE